MPGEDSSALIEPRSKRLIGRPYRSKYAPPCKHISTINVDLGYDFVTDMLVLEFALDKEKINVSKGDTLWLNRAAQSLSEALRLAACKELNVEFSRETVIGQSTVDHDDPLVRAGGHSDMGTLRDLFHIV